MRLIMKVENSETIFFHRRTGAKVVSKKAPLVQKRTRERHLLVKKPRSPGVVIHNYSELNGGSFNEIRGRYGCKERNFGGEKKMKPTPLFLEMGSRFEPIAGRIISRQRATILDIDSP